MGVISNGTTLLDAGALDSGVATGAMTLIKTVTASTSSTISFVDGASGVVLDDTYKEYIIKFTDVHLGSDDKRFTLQGSIDAGSNYNVNATTSTFRSVHLENDNEAKIEYTASHDSDNGTAFFQISDILGSGNNADDCIAGFLQLFNPSSTTFVKHFKGRFNANNTGECIGGFGAGYFNTTSAIDAIQFKADAGNIDAGTFKLYGIK